MSQQTPLTGRGKTVCVTGASGYVGAHLVKQLLERGYRVKGTVRDASNTEAYGWLHQLAEGTPGGLELYSAVLETPGSFDEAVKDCDYVCHVAAAVKTRAKDPQKEIVDVTVNGTRNVFDSILKAKCAKRVVLTSSIAAVTDKTRPNEYVFSESDWHTELTLGEPYPMSKVLSERLASKACEEQRSRGEPWSFELLVVIPGVIIGEVLHKSHQRISVGVVKKLMDGSLPLVPDFYLSIVHVRDVALAHVLCLEKENAKGRYLVSQETDTPFLEISSILRKEYPNSSAPTGTMPNWVLSIIALFTPIALVPGQRRAFSTTRAREDLGLEFTPLQRAVLDTARSLIDFKLVPDPTLPKKSLLSHVF